MTPPYSSGSDQQYIVPGAAGSVLTSNGPGQTPSYQGGSGGEKVNVTGDYAVLATDTVIEANGPNNQVITLPGTGLVTGKRFSVIAVGQGSPVKVVAPAGTSINLIGSFTLSNRFSAVTVEWDGDQYFIVSQYSPTAETVSMDKWFEPSLQPTKIPGRAPGLGYVVRNLV